MHHIIYMSTTTEPLTDDDLRKLLLQARADNAALDVTGVLLYDQRNVVQVLEGEREVLHRLYDKIQADPRHYGVVKLADKAVAARSFADWSMGFRPVDSATVKGLKGYTDPRRVDFDTAGLGQADALLLRIVQTFVPDTEGL